MSRPQKVLVLAVVVYVALFFGLAKRCYEVFGYDSGGTAVFNNMMWNTLHGKPFHISALTTAEATKPVNNFAIHAAYFWVFLVPLYALIPDPRTLMFCQSLALGLAAWPAYRIAKRVLEDEWAAVGMAIALILMPGYVSQNVNQVQEPSFLPVVLLWTVWFFIEGRFRAFMIAAFLACLNRENVPLAVMFFGLWAWWERRSWRWRLAPVVLGASYFAFVTWVAMPFFREGEPWHVAKQFEHLGRGPFDIVRNVFVEPSRLLNHVFSEPNLTYLSHLLIPLGGWLGLTHPAALLAVPDLAANILSNNSALKVIAWHYHLTITPALFVGLLFSLRRVERRLQTRLAGRHLPAVAAGFALLAAAHWFLWFQPAMFRKLPYHDSLVKAVRMIPRDASVLSSFRIQAHFSSRARYDALSVFQHRPEYAARFEYVVLDANERRFPPLVTREFFDQFYRSPDYQLVFAENNVFVFRRKDGGAKLP